MPYSCCGDPEDKASISVLSLVLTTYSFYFCVQAPDSKPVELKIPHAIL